MSNSLNNPIKWVFIERALQILIALFLNIIVARYLGIEQFGLLQVGLSSVAVFSSIGLLCSAEVVSPLYSQNKRKYIYIFEQVFVIRILLSLIAIFGFSIYIYITHPENLFLMLCLMIGILFQEPFNTFGLYFQVEGKQNILSKIRLYGVFLKFLLIVIFIFFGIDFGMFGIPYLFEYIFVAILLLIFFRKIKGKMAFFFDMDIIKKLLSSGFVFGVGIASMVAMQKSDRIVLSILDKDMELGIYSAAIQIAENWFFLSTMLVQAIVSKNIYQLSNKKANENIVKISLIFLLVTFFAAVIGFFFAEPIMGFLYGYQFEEAGYYLSFLLFVAIFVFADAIFSTKILMNKDGYIFSLKWVLALIVTYAYAFLSSKYFDGFKVEYMPAIGYGIAALFSLIYFFKKRHEDLVDCM